jgi:integrase
MRNTIIKTNLFRVRYTRDDGTKQLKVLAKVGYHADSKFNELKRFEISVKDRFNNLYTVTDSQYKRLRAQPPSKERLFLFQLETKVKKIILDLIEDGKDFTTKEINNRLNSVQAEENGDFKVRTWNDFLAEINHGKVDTEYQQEEIDKIESAIEEAIADGAVLTEEDIDNIKDSVGIDLSREKEKKAVTGMTLYDRYAKAKFDRNSIIEAFGYCWSVNSKNGDPFVPDSYKQLIFQLTDYILNGKSVSRSTRDFNLKWVEGFLSFKAKHGFPKTHIRGYSPFDIMSYQESFVSAKREGYKAASFQKLVKVLKQYIRILQKARIISINAINTDLFKASDFISRKTNTDNFTKIEFTLEYEEIEQLLKASLEDQQQKLAVDMYIIQMFAGGLRPSELYNGGIRFYNNHISFFRSKNKRICKNPYLPEVKKVLSKYPDGLPEFMPIHVYREKLKEVARHFKWNRIIEEPNTKLNPDQDTVPHELHEVFSPFTARKTFINYLANLGLADELIIQFTDHTDVKILKHYKRKLNLQQKKMIIEKHLKVFYESIAAA